MEDGKTEFDASEIEYVSYGGEHHLPLIMDLVDQELSEPYSIFTYRYFVYLWPHLSFLVSSSVIFNRILGIFAWLLHLLANFCGRLSIKGNAWGRWCARWVIIAILSEDTSPCLSFSTITEAEALVSGDSTY